MTMVEENVMRLEIDEIDNINIDSMLKHNMAKEKSTVRYGKSKDRDWIAVLTYNPSLEKNFSRKFINVVNDEYSAIPAKQLEVGRVYERAYEYDSSHKYADRITCFFIVRDISDTEVTIELFQTALKAHKQLARERISNKVV